MADDARLDDQSSLPDGTVMSPGETRRGAPAVPADVDVPCSEPVHPQGSRSFLFGCIYLVMIHALGFLWLAPGLSIARLCWMAFENGGMGWGIASLLLAVPMGVVSYCLLVAALKAIVLRRTRPGVHSLESAAHLRRWFVDSLLGMSRMWLLPVYSTIYVPHWLRILGAKIGRRSEVATVWRVVPDLVEIGDESFLADGCIIGGRRIHRGVCETRPNRIGRRAFVGNSAVLPKGANLGSSCLLGVMSAPPSGSTANGTDWLGSPAFELPGRQKVGSFDDAVTFRPATKLVVQRALIDALRILLPGYIGLAAFVLGTLSLEVAYLRWGSTAMLALSPVVAFGAGLGSALTVVAIKWLVMRRFVPVVRPLWTPYVWANEMINGIYESVMAPFLGLLLGTPFVAPFLRLIGCKVGRHAFIGTTLFSEFDLVEVGDYAALNVGATIQTHLFEDRVMKSSHLKIGEGCSVGNMAVILYDTVMQPGSSLGPLSLLMKGETLPARGRWHGIPTQPVATGAQPAGDPPNVAAPAAPK